MQCSNFVGWATEVSATFAINPIWLILEMASYADSVAILQGPLYRKLYSNVISRWQGLNQPGTSYVLARSDVAIG